MTAPKTPLVVKRWIADHSVATADDPSTRLARLRRHWPRNAAGESATGERTVTHEFLRLVDWVLQVDSTAREQILADPLAGWWLRTTEQFTNPHSGQRPLDAAVGRRHLHRFGAIAAAVAAAAGRDLQLETPLAERLPLVVIGTPWSLAATGNRPPSDVQLLGISDGLLVIAVAGQVCRLSLQEKGTSEKVESLSRLGLRLHRASLSRSEGCRIRLQPHAFHWPVHLPDDAPAWSRCSAGIDERTTAEPVTIGRVTFERALSILARFHPRTLVSLRDRVRLAAPLLAAEPVMDDSSELVELAELAELKEFPCDSLPGALVTKSFDHPLLLAERMVHQLAFERAATRSTTSLEADISVCRFWLEAVLSDELEPEARGYAIDRLRYVPRKLSQDLRRRSPATATTQVRPVAGNNAHDKVAALQRSLAWLSLPTDPPAWEFRGGRFVQLPPGVIRRAA